MTTSRTIVGVQENHFSFNFLLENNHHIVHNQFNISKDHLMQIEQYEVGNNRYVNLACNDEIDHIQVLPMSAELLDIRSKQNQLSKGYSTLTLS